MCMSLHTHIGFISEITLLPDKQKKKKSTTSDIKTPNIEAWTEKNIFKDSEELKFPHTSGVGLVVCCRQGDWSQIMPWTSAEKRVIAC